MSYEVKYREKYASFGKDAVYVKYPDDDSLHYLKSADDSLHRSFFEKMKILFREVFLPQGYPESVSEDYFEYQLWDSIQAFCSTLSGTLTTQAILKGVGVGDSSATPLSAAIAWILKDGTGMVGRILFAWKKGTSLDADCKKWRIFADILNDSALSIEMFFLPLIPLFSTELLCLSTTMKAVVGVAGGATKAATTQHQAIRNNMADVSAKDGSQETCLNLIGSVFGILLLSFVAGSELLAKFIFVICIMLHVYSNYRAVKALNFKTLNKERLLIILKTYLKYQIIENSAIVNNKESVFLGSGITDKDLCGFQIELGCSLRNLISNKLITTEELDFYSRFSESLHNSYMIIINRPTKTIYVPLKPDYLEKDIIVAFFHSIVLGIASCVSNNVNLSIISEVYKQGTPLDYIMEGLQRNTINDFRNKMKEFIINTSIGEDAMNKHNIPFKEITLLDELACKDLFENFLSALKNNGWLIERHHISVGEWRGIWDSSQLDKKIL